MEVCPVKEKVHSELKVPNGAKDIRAIAAKAGKDPRSVVAAYAGLGARETLKAVTEAAVSLGFTSPPERLPVGWYNREEGLAKALSAILASNSEENRAAGYLALKISGYR